MDLLRRIGLPFRFYSNVLSKRNEKIKSNAFTKYEYYAYKFQSIVIWEHPSQTLSCLFLIQLFFWMMVNLCWKFYGIIFAMLLVLSTHQVWTEKIWPEIRAPQSEMTTYQKTLSDNPKILTTSQIEEYFNNIVLHAKMTFIRLKNLRVNNPTMFCSVLSLFFGSLSLIGSNVSGLWLFYTIVMMIFLAPGCYIHVLPQSAKTSLKRYLKDFALLLSELSESDDDFEDYIPKLPDDQFGEVYASVLEVNNADNDYPSVEEDAALCGMAMPSYDDSSVDGCEKFSAMKGDLDFMSDSSSTASDASSSMKFTGTHFNNATDEFDTTTSSDEDMETTPARSVEQRQRHRPSLSQSLLGSIASKLTLPDINQMGRSLVNMMPSTTRTTTSTRPPPNVSYNTDEEFEMINESDIN